MIQGKWFAPGEDLSPLLPVRNAVFGFGSDPLDRLSWNVLVYEDDVPAAAGRIWWQDGAFWIGDIGVLPDRRGHRLGDLTLRLLLFKAQSHAAREVRLRSPAGAAGFFARLGFRPDPEAGDPEEMLLPGEEIELDSCKSCRKANCPNRQA